ncbi:hypothetical protein [Nitratireductor sp. XY-223]|uniref:hypothetical protein n=1 Tax=Nitratireductor sp. XY-223 TaxID=2561926 RepID=UPI0010AB4464|nr:hypothetical protein [Nitratireductor sp. XY-223]
MLNYPRPVPKFQHCFADEACRAPYLADRHWSSGFCGTVCGLDRARTPENKPLNHECRNCQRRTSVKAGTMYGDKLPLTMWFLVAFPMARHSSCIPASRVQEQLGLGTYKAAWLFSAELRCAMVPPERSPLTGRVEIDGTNSCRRTGTDPPVGGSHDGKKPLQKHKANPRFNYR